MYKQLADRLADAIAEGQYPPGSMLPSETQLMERYGVSRPTVRSAVAELRNMGLADSQHGRGTLVRNTALPPAAIPRTITRTGKQYTTSAGWDPIEAEPATVTRGHATGVVARLLERDEEAVFIVDRLLVHPVTGRTSHRTIIPFDVAAQVPELAETPDAQPAAIYAALTAAGHQLTWTETVTARSPHPDERTALRITGTEPILVTYRITATADEQRPLILEELHTSADRAHLHYRVTAQQASQ
jgi:GntR family transcriptional regulator